MNFACQNAHITSHFSEIFPCNFYLNWAYEFSNFLVANKILWEWDTKKKVGLEIVLSISIGLGFRMFHGSLPASHKGSPCSLFSSVQFSHSVVSDSLRPHESQHTRPPCPSPTPGIHSGSCPLSRWYHPAISSSVVPFSSCPQSLPASESFPMSQLFTWGGQSTGVSASASVLPMNTQNWSRLGWTGWISLQSKGLSRVFSLLEKCKSKLQWDITSH